MGRSSTTNHQWSSPLLRSSGKAWGVRSRCLLSRTQAPRIAAVFVHGFGDDPEKAWSGFPEAIVSRPAFSDVDAYFFGYESKLQQAAVSADQLKAFLIALGDSPAIQVVNPSLSQGRRSATWRYEALVIAAYSLGAVVSRLALLQLTTLVPQPRWLSRVRVGLYAPAHRGARIVALAYGALGDLGEMLGQQAAMRLALRFARQRWVSLEDLEPGCETLRNLLVDTRRATRQNGTSHLHARVLHGTRDKIVHAARFLIDQHEDPVEGADHLAVPKPARARSAPLEFLESLLQLPR